jgi:hypothetical protein
MESACPSGRSTSTRAAKSGRVSNQRNRSRRRTISPTITSAGVPSPACSTNAAIVPTVPTTVRCAGSDARSTTAAGVSALRPFAMSVSMSEAKRRSPMKKTIVCVAVASRDQSCVSWLFCGDSVAVTYARLLELSRWVSDSPAYAAAASGEGTPGTTSNAIPRDASHSASSLPRPKR